MLYRVAHEMPDLDHVPAELRQLAARCLAGDPARRPAPGDLLADLSHVRPAKGWLPGLTVMPSPSYQPLKARAQPAVGQGNSPPPASRQPMASGSASSQQSVLTWAMQRAPMSASSVNETRIGICRTAPARSGGWERRPRRG